MHNVFTLQNKLSIHFFHFSFEAKYTSPYGDYVESVNGVKESYTVDGYYWEFFVNTIGVSIGMFFNDFLRIV